mmetsp:Transcript_22982/g.32149  ORF Transcript_22982/g.32149 Transcript_22982/m.32149 type:complete len:151 (+) Transcript_22982:121-573(+)
MMSGSRTKTPSKLEDVIYSMKAVPAVSPRGTWKLTLTRKCELVMEQGRQKLKIPMQNVRRTMGVTDQERSHKFVALQLRKPIKLGNDHIVIILFKFSKKCPPKVEWDEAASSFPFVGKLKGKNPSRILTSSWKIIRKIQTRNCVHACVDM